jgi:hypothetical protein
VKRREFSVEQRLQHGKAHPEHRISGGTILHFGPRAEILLSSKTTREFHFAGMPAGITPSGTRTEHQRKPPMARKLGY